jgi:hypothetical protein
MKEKTYYIEVKLTFDNAIQAKSKKEAIEIVKESMVDEYGICPEDNEIKVTQ